MEKDEYIRREREADERRRKEFLNREKSTASKAKEQLSRPYGAVSSRIHALDESIKRRQVEAQIKREKKAEDREEAKFQRQRNAELKIYGKERTPEERLYAQDLQEQQAQERKDKWEKRKQAVQNFNNKLAELGEGSGTFQGVTTGLNPDAYGSSINYSGLDSMYGVGPVNTDNWMVKPAKKTQGQDPLMSMYGVGGVYKNGKDPLVELYSFGKGDTLGKSRKKGRKGSNPMGLVNI